MRKRDLRALRQSAAESHYYQPGPDDESDSEGGEADADLCWYCGGSVCQKPFDDVPCRRPQDLSEQQEQQR